jgi:hypothetical protein
MMEGYWGMGSTIASHGVTQRVGIGGGGRPGERGGPEGKDFLEGSLGGRIERNLDEILRRTEALIRTEMVSVLAVAHALETYKTLTGDDIEAVIEGRMGPLVDGRVYAAPGFQEVAEAYHARVLDAHRRHTKVDEPLPMPARWAPRPVASQLVQADMDSYGNGFAPPPV